MAKEKREAPRVRTDFGVKYKIKGSNLPLTQAVSVNISESGIMIKISEKLNVGALLELKLTFPPSYGSLTTVGRVEYVIGNYWDEYPPYRCGVEFLELNEQDSLAIKKYVNEAIAKLDWEHWL